MCGCKGEERSAGNAKPEEEGRPNAVEGDTACWWRSVVTCTQVKVSTW